MITDIQKASILKRIAAGIFDAILFITLAVGFVWMMNAIVDFDHHYDTYQSGLNKYEEQYGVDFDADYQALSEDQKASFDEAVKVVNADQKMVKNLSILMNLTLISVTFGIFLAMFVLEFIIPLFLKNGQTLGKKIFGIGLVRVDGVQLTTLQLFVRAVLGKFTLETMIPVYIIIMLFFGVMGFIGILVLGAILLLQLILLIVTRTNSLIHDSLAGTVAVDISSQMIFRTTDDLIAYKKKIHAEQAARSNY